jgi:hypothetical protein
VSGTLAGPSLLWAGPGVNRTPSSAILVHAHYSLALTPTVLPPITETGFDQFVLDPKEGETMLDRVVEDDWICCLGRPLYVFFFF